MHFKRRADKASALSSVPLFAGLNQRQLQVVAGIADEVETTAGQVLVKQGGLAQEFVLIVRGNTRVEQDGKTIASMGAGEFFGEMAVLDGAPRSASVIAEEPGLVLVIHARSFNTLLDEAPEITRKMLVTLVRRLRAREASLAH